MRRRRSARPGFPPAPSFAISWAAILFIGMVLAPSCSRDDERTGFVVFMDTDYDWPGEASRIRATVRSDSSEESVDFLLGSDSNRVPLPNSFLVLAKDPKSRASIEVELALSTPSDEVLVTRVARVNFVPHQVSTLQMFLARSCREVWAFCTRTETCVDGSCVPSQIDPLPPDAGPRNDATPQEDAGALQDASFIPDATRIECDEADDCGVRREGEWSECAEFESVCDESGVQSRTVVSTTCSAAGRCEESARVETRTCARSTEAMSCAAAIRLDAECVYRHACANEGDLVFMERAFRCEAEICAPIDTAMEIPASTLFTRDTSDQDCDDSDACTIRDRCENETCRGSPKCDDGLGCTMDSCQAGDCVHEDVDCGLLAICSENCVGGICLPVCL